MVRDHPPEGVNNTMNVMLYALSTCAWCRRTKRFFSENGIEYDYVDVDLLEADEKEERRAELKSFNPQGTYPTIVIDGDKVVIGYNKDRLREALGL
jgi:glutaredoxin